MSIKLIKGDCTDEYKNIDKGSVDLILVDPPYGTIKGINLKGWNDKTIEWDNKIEINDIIEMAKYLLRRNGRLVIFAQEPLTSELVQSSTHRLKFNYRYTWIKDHFANNLSVNKAPVKYTEDILVYTSKHDSHKNHPLREYFGKILDEYMPTTKKEIHETLGHQGADHCFRVETEQFSIPTEKTYNELVEHFDIDEMDGFLEYEEIERIDDDDTNAIFNLPTDKEYKSNVLKYKKPYNNNHPTEKPVDLLKDLIKTYTYKGDLVVDFAMGSGSTGVAAIKLDRDFIGIEKEEEFYRTAVNRIMSDL